MSAPDLGELQNIANAGPGILRLKDSRGGVIGFGPTAALTRARRVLLSVINKRSEARGCEANPRTFEVGSVK